MRTLALLFLILPFLIFGQQKQPKVGLVLSGGGAKGFAHVGVLKEIEKAGMQIDYIGGTSMGAVVGSFYAAGYSATQIEAIVKELDFNDLLQDKVARKATPFFKKTYAEKYAVSLPVKKDGLGLPLGLSKGQNVLNALTELLAPVDEVVDFKKLPIPFYCVATNIETSTAKVFEKGSLPLAIRASAAFPSLLNPVDVGGELLIDGGVVNNFPVDVMQKKGVDIIIGVNVEGKLLKGEELNSVASVLLQIINFQMYKNSDAQKKMLDVYIRPDILEYSVVSFKDKEKIINEGVKKAKLYRRVFKAIAKQQVVKRNRPVLCTKISKFLVDRIIVNGNKNYTTNYVLGKLQLKEGDSVSYKEMSKKISTLTATGNFSRIDYHLEKSFEGKKLVLDLKEDVVQQYLKLGLHYDLLYKSAVVLGYNHKKLLFQNDEFLFDVAIGDRLRYNMEYFIDNGLAPSFGISSRYNSFKRSFSFNAQINTLNIKYEDFTNKLYLQTTLDKKYALGFGLMHKKVIVDSETILNNGKPTLFDDTNYVNAFSFLKIDVLDKAVFPTKGFYFNANFNWFLWSDRDNVKQDFHTTAQQSFSQFSQISGKLSFASTFFKKLTFQYTSEAGYTLGNKSLIFDFRLGGYNKNYINNFVPFYGYEMGGLANQSYLRSEFDFRYALFKKQNISFIANYARVEEDVLESGSLFKNTKSGYGVGYNIETFLGPISLRYAWSPDHNKKFWLFNLGFWF